MMQGLVVGQWHARVPESNRHVGDKSSWEAYDRITKCPMMSECPEVCLGFVTVAGW